MLGDLMFSTTNKAGYGIKPYPFFIAIKNNLKFYKYLLTNL